MSPVKKNFFEKQVPFYCFLHEKLACRHAFFHAYTNVPVAPAKNYSNFS